jgi:tetratricopeptide (TPR) repeat protein
MLKTPMIGMKDQSDPIFYLTEQAEKGRLLILVDDLTQSADKIDLSLLNTIEADVVVASQYPIEGYGIIDVTKRENMLTTADCRKLFLQERYPDNSSEKISKEEIISLDRILNEKTAYHYFVIKRLGAIARENGLSVNELEMKLDKEGFRIFDTQDNHLNDEISKLFQINKLPGQQKKILSVICYFPELLLGLSQWAKWLKEAYNMTREECHKQLTKLADNFWLIKENDLIRVHLVVAVAIQDEIPADNLVKIKLVQYVYYKANKFEIDDRIDWHILAIELFKISLKLLRIQDAKVSHIQQELLLYGLQNYWLYFLEESLCFLNDIDKQYNMNCTIHAYILSNMGDIESRIGMIDTAQTHYKEAVRLYRQKNRNLDLAHTLKRLGDVKVRQSQFKCAESYYEYADRLYFKEDYPLGRAIIKLVKGNLYSITGEIVSSMKNYKDAEQFFKLKNLDLELANTLKSKGDLEYRIGKEKEAENDFQEAERLFYKVRDNTGLANTLISRGRLEHRFGKSSEALDHYNKAKDLYKLGQDYLGIANALRGIGDVTEDYESANTFYDSALILYEKVKDQLGKANTSKSKGDLAMRMGKSDNAYNCFKQAEELYQQENCNLGRANTLLSMGDRENVLGNYQAAESLYSEAQELYHNEQDSLGLGNIKKSREILEKKQEYKHEANRRFFGLMRKYKKETK